MHVLPSFVAERWTRGELDTWLFKKVNFLPNAFEIEAASSDDVKLT